MDTLHSDQRKKHFILSLVFVALTITNITRAQQNMSASRNISHADSMLSSFTFSFLLQASLLSQAKVETTAGSYKLTTRPHTAFSAGLLFQRNLDSLWSMVYGLQLNFLNSNYYVRIPDSDLPGFLSTSGAPQIEEKQVYYWISAPVLLARNFACKSKGHYTAQLGVRINYSGFSNDEATTVRLADTSLRFTTIFSADVQSNNNKKPWVSYLGGIWRNFLLQNRSMISVGIFLELSKTNFIQANYQIMVPNQPVSSGKYVVNGSGAGVQLQYTFPKKRNR